METKRTFTRQELYELVWSTPMSKLCERFDISDRGLSKTCERHHVPVPGRGYWAKVEAGQPATKTPLWKIDNPSIETVQIGRLKPTLSPYVASRIETSKKSVEEHARKVSLGAEIASTQRQTKATAKEPRVVDLREFEKPHPSIRMLASQLRSAKADDIGEIAVSGIRINQLSRQRVTTFLNHLATELERLEVALSVEQQNIVANLGPDAIGFTIKEAKQKEKHVPTDTELEKKRKHDLRRSNDLDLFFPKQFWPEYDYFHIGNLSFEIDNYAGGARKRWTDAKTQRLEGLLNSIVDGIRFHLAYERTEREERAERERQRIYLSRRRELHRKREEREEQRLEFLQCLADYQREATDLRQILAMAETVSGEASPEYQRMIEWTRQRLARIMAENEVTLLSETLRANDLFPEVDPFLDPEGDPPAKQNYWDP